ncbi:MAG: S8 family serine peptidase [Xenococcaceae cyanobacterium MO_207.B15]|nr:S8 family serine peptidase [Xenococcaceae cyanobacterium MO_207.B15]
MATSDFDILTIIEQTPLFREQWHLKNTGQTGGTPGADANILDAWSIATGEGVVIGIIDDFVQHTHPDLNDNYSSSLSVGGFDFQNIFGLLYSATHGTLVAGIAVAEGDNDIGIIGSAPDATFVNLPLNLDSPDLFFFDFELNSYNPFSHKNQDIDIYNISRGSTENFLDSSSLINDIRNSIQQGRGGLGNIYVVAAGNDGDDEGNVNYQALRNSRYTIAVGAIDHNGQQSYYSNPGASLLISGYSSNENLGIISTTNINDIGFFPGDSINGEYDTNFGGTSAATPLVSGVIALMLEANPNLTWRDVQHILVETAELNDPNDPDWVKNGAGHDINYKYGFGGIDATAAVNAAVNWETVVEEVSLTSGLIDVNSIIPDDDTVGISSSFTIEEDIDLEWVEVVFDADHIERGDLEIVLTSPDGTESILAEQRDDEGDDYDNWVFTSARHWGESSQGEWILNISDEKSSIEGTWNSWQINLYGSDNLPTVDIMIDDITVSEDAENQTIDLSNVFSDADGDEITLAIQNNSNSELVTTTLDGNDLTLDFQNNQFGTADITILATANGQSVEDTFTVTVNSIDDAPTVANSIADVTVDEDADNQIIDLGNVFEDIDSENIQLEIASNSNSQLVTPLLEGNDLTLDFLDNQFGTADITIRATADGQSVEDTFTVTVNPIDDAPIVANPIADLTVDEDAENQIIDLSNVFRDVDEDVITLTVSNNSNSQLVTTTLDGNNLTLDFLDNQFGTADITIRAAANGQSVEDTFTVTVNPFDPLPIVANPITDVTVDEDAQNQIIDLSNVFENIDSDTIELEIANNSNPDLVTPLLNGNDLTLDFLENQFGTGAIKIRATADGQSVDDTFTLTVNPIDDPPMVANPIADVTVDEDADNQIIDLSNVFEDIDSENIQLEIASNSNSELVTPLLEGNDLTLDFLDNQSGTADITIRATADGKSVDDTFTVTVNPSLETIELFRFRNTTFETGTYVFVGAAERDAILDNPDFNQTFELEGDGNPAFVASTESGDDLEGFYRLSSLDNPGTFLFVGQGEYDAIFAEGSDQRDRWEKQGFDSDGTTDIPEFYLYGVGANVGTAFNRFQNRANNTFLYAGPQETEAINTNPDFSAAFFDQGGAFEAF